MFKELFLALTLGSLLGFGLTGSYLALKKQPASENSNTIINADVTTNPLPSSTANNNYPTTTPSARLDSATHQLSVDSPEDKSVSTSPKITLKGTTTPGSIIIISTIKQTFTINSEDNGSFSQDLDLESGANLIQVDSISPNNEISTNQILITYSTAKF